MTPQWWLRLAGFGTWLVASLPALVAALNGSFVGPVFWVWLAAFLGFGIGFTLSTCLPGHSAARNLALLGLQSICALTLVATTRDGFAAAMLVVVAGQLLWVCELPAAIVWVAVQTAALLVIFWSSASAIASISIAGAYGGFQLFAVAASAVAIREQRGAEALARVNAELSATRELLAESSRAAERLRISRDLHDTLGHHLTALSLQLDVASRVSSPPASDHISQAHAIARLLLSDVRAVVGSLREQGRLNLAPMLRELSARSSSPVVHLEMPDDLDLEHPGHAQTLLRSVQEIITNASKHGGAGNLWIRISRAPEGVVLDARDDGRGSERPVFGNGLTGMRERFAEYRGHIEVTSRRGEGFSVRGVLPGEESGV